MSFGSNRRADRTNRAVLSILGILAVAGGAAGLTATFLEGTRDRAPIDASQRAWLLDHGTALGLVALAALGLLTVLALVWLRHQLHPIPQQGDLALGQTDRGTTTLHTAALLSVVEAELADLRGVTAATARIRERDPDTVDVLLDVDDTAHIRRLAEEADTLVLARARRATARPDLALALECRPVAPPASGRVT